MTEPSAPAEPRRWLPFRSWWPLLAGALVGLGLRLVFSGRAGAAVYEAMMASFIYLGPLLVGIVTVYVAERSRRRSWAYYFWAAFLANLLFVAGTVLVNIEGAICAVVIAPLFALLGGVGGLIMGAVCRVTKWPKQVLLSFGALPLVLGGLEGSLPVPVRVSAVERNLLIDARPEAIWRQILNAEDIQPVELENA